MDSRRVSELNPIIALANATGEKKRVRFLIQTTGRVKKVGSVTASHVLAGRAIPRLRVESSEPGRERDESVGSRVGRSNGLLSLLLSSGRACVVVRVYETA